MARKRTFRVVVASDGSPEASNAVTAAVAFPWPEPSRAVGVVARPRFAFTSPRVQTAVDDATERVVGGIRRVLGRRWSDADVVVLTRPPVEAILTQARGAGAIVIGSRGLGLAGRLLLGSVSRGVVRGARCPTLVVKRGPRAFTRLLVGLDGSPNARRAVAFVAMLPPPRGGHVTLVTVTEPVRPSSMNLVPAGVRAVLTREATALEAERLRTARRRLQVAARALKRRGWRVTMVARTGTPVTELLRASAAARTDAIVVGARGTSGAERVLLGSVADGLLTQAPNAVLVVR